MEPLRIRQHMEYIDFLHTTLSYIKEEITLQIYSFKSLKSTLNLCPAVAIK
jgi:hypothetical protein